MFKKAVSSILAAGIAFGMAAVMPDGGLCDTAIKASASDAKIYKGHTYQVFDDSVTWSQAKALCEKKGGHLVTITSAKEEAFVEKLIDKYEKMTYHIGLTDTNGFQWVTGETFDWSNHADWANAESDQHTYIIVSDKGDEMFVHAWADHDDVVRGDMWDYTNSGYVCEWDAQRVSALSITLSKTEYSYNGKAKKPKITVKNGKTTLKEGTDYTVTYKNNKNIGKAKAVIKGKGDYSGSISKAFTINPAKTGLKKASSSDKGELKVTYKKVKGVTGYQVTYSTSKKFTKSTTKTATVKGVSNLSNTISDLRSGKTYYVKVRTYKTVSGKKYYSDYTKVKKIKVK